VVETQTQGPLYHKQVANDKGNFFEIKSDRMLSFDDDFNETFIEYNRIDFVDFTTHKDYELDAITKTGTVSELDASKVGMFKGLNMSMVYYLSNHENYIADLKKTGNEKIIGRDATIYTDEAALSYNTDRKFWIDDEYGFTLKSEEIHGDNKITMTVTEFKLGGATVEGLVNLDEYDFDQNEDDDSSTFAEPEIIEGVLSLEAMKKAASDAGFTVNGGWFTLTNWTTHSKEKPKDGFQISVRKDGSNFMGIAVIEFETEEIAKEYIAFAATPDAYYDGIIYRSGVFTVDINKSLVADHEAKLMEALKKAGWE
jgi:hypothetical protein